MRLQKKLLQLCFEIFYKVVIQALHPEVLIWLLSVSIDDFYLNEMDQDSWSELESVKDLEVLAYSDGYVILRWNIEPPQIEINTIKKSFLCSAYFMN